MILSRYAALSVSLILRASLLQVHDYISHEGENWTHGEVGECVQQLISQATKPTIFENAQKRLAARM